MIAMKYLGQFSSTIKMERQKIYKNLSKILSKEGPKLEPISYATVKHFAKAQTWFEIYRVTDMNTGFKKNLDKVDGDVTYFASWMSGGYGSNMRVRKYALVNLHNGDQYIVFQECCLYSLRISVVNTRTLERVAVRSAAEAAGVLAVQNADIEDLPLLINIKGQKLRKMVQERLGA